VKEIYSVEKILTVLVLWPVVPTGYYCLSLFYETNIFGEQYSGLFAIKADGTRRLLKVELYLLTYSTVQSPS